MFYNMFLSVFWDFTPFFMSLFTIFAFLETSKDSLSYYYRCSDNKKTKHKKL